VIAGGATGDAQSCVPVLPVSDLGCGGVGLERSVIPSGPSAYTAAPTAWRSATTPGSARQPERSASRPRQHDAQKQPPPLAWTAKAS
jgi:hypothetical protein